MSEKIVLRYAPSPTGPQHIGGIRTALYCYYLAQQKDGELILRIEDTDQTRFVAGAEQFIVDSCSWLGIAFTQGAHVGGPNAPYRQSERTELYQKYAQQLLDQGHAYLAFDTPEELEAMRQRLEEAGADNRTYNYMTRMSMRNSLTLSAEEVQQRLTAGEPHVVRFKVPEKSEIRFHDIIRGHLHFHGSHVDDKVLLKSDGLPTYHLANVVDDHHMGVTHVIRGEEWLPSTPLHVLLYDALGWREEMPQFAHLALLLGPKGKLSKRAGDKYGIPVFPMDWQDKASGDTWKGYKEMGYLPEALMNYLSLLGWHPGGEQELLTREELIARFSLERCHHAGAKFDMAKLNSFQQHYLRQKPGETIAAALKPIVDAAGLPYPNEAYLAQVADLMRERITFVRDIPEQAPYFFRAPTTYNEKMTRKNWKTLNKELLTEFRGRLNELTQWSAPLVQDHFKTFLAEKEVGFGKLGAPLRLALTGLPSGPGAFDIAETIGRTEALARIDRALAELPASDQA
ncbi:MAG: glutamate--tRNA ligase [Bacteroidota bacterium]